MTTHYQALRFQFLLVFSFDPAVVLKITLLSLIDTTIVIPVPVLAFGRKGLLNYSNLIRFTGLRVNCGP